MSDLSPPYRRNHDDDDDGKDPDDEIKPPYGDTPPGFIRTDKLPPMKKLDPNVLNPPTTGPYLEKGLDIATRLNNPTVSNPQQTVDHRDVPKPEPPFDRTTPSETWNKWLREMKEQR